VIVDSPELPIGDFERQTGWLLKPEGACRGGVCVPLPPQERTIHLGLVAERLGMGVVHDEGHCLWAVGPSTVNGRALESTKAPDFVSQHTGTSTRVNMLSGGTEETEEDDPWT
jgi:hypothetical protein